MTYTVLKTPTYTERATRLDKLADSDEKIAASWIKENPHAALIYALATHETHWHGCECDLDTILKKSTGVQNA